jgi:hypothetical protein
VITIILLFDTHRYDLLCLEGIAQALRFFNGKQEIPRYKVANISRESMIKMHVKPEVVISEIHKLIVRDNTAVGTKVAVDTHSVDTHSVNATNHPEHDTLPAYSGTSQTKRPNHATSQIMGSNRAVQAVSSNPSVTPQIVEPAEVINHIRQDSPSSHKSCLTARYNLPYQATASPACTASLPILKEYKISKGNLFHMRIS